MKNLVTKKFIAKDGVSVAYQYMPCIGKNAPTLVFLNGGLATMSDWYRLDLNDLNTSHAILLHDFRGQGSSVQQDGDITFEHHADDLCNLLSVLDIDEVILVATSYGSLVAQHMVGKMGRRIQRIMMMSALSKVKGKTQTIVQNLKRSADENNSYDYFEISLPAVYGSTYLNLKRDGILAYIDKNCRNLPSEIMMGQSRLCQNLLNAQEPISWMQGCAIPTLLVCGKEDEFTPIDESRALASKMSCAKMHVVPNIGHLMLVEDPSLVQNLLTQFLSSNSWVLEPGTNEVC